MNAEIWKNGSPVSRPCAVTRHGELSLPLRGQRIRYWFFPKLTLLPPIINLHMAGQGLAAWLDNCYLIQDGPPPVAEGLRYVHGRSEVRRGEPRVSLVLLVEKPDDMLEEEWVTELPRIYSSFLASTR